MEVDEQDLPFRVEYSKSSVAECKWCTKLIIKGDLRIASMHLSPIHDGKFENFYHHDCFFLKEDCLFFKESPESEGDFANFVNIRTSDQNWIRGKIAASKELPGFEENLETDCKTEAKKLKLENMDEADSIQKEAEFNKAFEEQNEFFFKYRDLAMKDMSKKDIIAILNHNRQTPYRRDSRKLHNQFADLLAFGALKACKKCHGRKFHFISSGYSCDGNLSGWTKCKNLEKKPDKTVCKIPENIVKKYEALSEYKSKVEDRLIKYVQPGAKIRAKIFEKGERLISFHNKSVPESLKPKLLYEGLSVDPDSNLQDIAHIYKDISGNIYSASLALTHIQKGKNSYYKLQILEEKNLDRYWLFRSWGRIGTKMAGHQTDPLTLNDAICTFKELFQQKTGNNFDNRQFFVKVPDKMYLISNDYGNEDSVENQIESELPIKVQDFMRLIFDVEAMKKIMIEFKLNVEKMPLGKISKKQIKDAYQVLKELNELIQNGTATNSQFIDASHRFYTLIPHNFGIDNPEILDTAKLVRQKSELLENLLEIEYAYSMINHAVGNDVDKNPIDRYYEQLKTELTPLEKTTEEYKLLQGYVENSHVETYRDYDLEILDIFKVERENEAQRFKPFKKLHNRKLLWHGSCLTNYAGILSHGLKIAPPEAPPNGYMFGKGIYFADMVSKSSTYCWTSKQNSIGILLLSEVALGEMFECKQACYVTSLPQNKHSTKGVGKTYPNPRESYYREDGSEIPLGKPITDDEIQSALLYNEFIVYNAAQVNIQYLFKMKFNYKD